MNSALKPVLPASGPQNPPVTTQLNKPIHAQGTPGNYGQASIAPNLVNLPHNNPNPNLTHPNPAHQTNHYSLNVPSAAQHYSSNNQSSIPASNHPVPNAPLTTGQNYSPSKAAPFLGGYQPNLGHPPNQNAIPPVSQTLPATQHPQPVDSSAAEKPQSNGTAQVKSPPKPPQQENHVNREKSPPKPVAVVEKPDEVKPTPPATPEQPKQDTVKSPEETKVALPTPEPTPPVAPVASATPAVETAPTDTAEDTKKVADEGVESSEIKENKSEVESNDTETAQSNSSPNNSTKTKEKIEPKAAATGGNKASPLLRTPTRKSKSDSPKSPVKTTTTQKSPSLSTKSKRTRIRTQPYQSPLPEIEIITKISSTTPKAKSNDDKLIVFYKNEFLAVRNSEGSFYICQAVQNIYKSSPKIRIRWLSQDKNEKSGEVYTPDFYDLTDFDCILTNLNLERVDKGRYRLPPAEKERTDSILKRSIAVEKGEASPSLTEEHPDGIDVSLYKEESQLKKRGSKRKASASRTRKANNTTKSPDQPKVRKVAAKTTKKVGGKRAVGKKVAAATPSTPTTSGDAKKANGSSRTDRAKRRSENHKFSPVVDQKKAKVLAKVARKSATTVSAASKAQSVTKNTKAPKATASSSKVQKTQQLKTSTRKTKKSKK